MGAGRLERRWPADVRFDGGAYWTTRQSHERRIGLLDPDEAKDCRLPAWHRAFVDRRAVGRRAHTATRAILSVSKSGLRGAGLPEPAGHRTLASVAIGLGE